MRLITIRARAAWALFSIVIPSYAARPPKAAEQTPLDRYIQEAIGRQPAAATQAAPGSIWSPLSRLTNVGSDMRAAQVDDVVTVVVNERASAIAKGTTKTQRQSAAASSVSAAGGLTRKLGPFANLANVNTQTSLNGDGATTRETALSTTLSTRVTHVLPNGYLVLEGSKEVLVNSERQIVTVRGVVRPADLSPDNLIRTDQVAQLEVKVNGKGVVNDAIRRPFILYRILLGLLPF